MDSLFGLKPSKEITWGEPISLTLEKLQETVEQARKNFEIGNKFAQENNWQPLSLRLMYLDEADKKEWCRRFSSRLKF